MSATEKDSSTELHTDSNLSDIQAIIDHFTTNARLNEAELNPPPQEYSKNRNSTRRIKDEDHDSISNSLLIFIISFISFIIIFYMFDVDDSTAKFKNKISTLKRTSCLNTTECLSINPPFEHSHLLIDDFQQYLNYFYDNSSSLISKWRLIYRGTTDGMNATAFHLHCDNQGETFTILSTTKGYLFGGYTDANWNTSSTSLSTYSQSTNAFIFSLMSSNKIPATKFSIDLQYRNYAIFNDILSGPIFGVMDRPDIGIYNSMNQFHCHIHHPSVYKDFNGLSGFPSSNDCIINEIEVFIPVFKEIPFFNYYIRILFKYIIALYLSLFMITYYESIEHAYNEKRLSDARINCCFFLFFLGINYMYGKLFVFVFFLLFYFLFMWISSRSDFHSSNAPRIEKWFIMLFLVLLVENLIFFG